MVLVLASGVWATNVIFTVQSELICTLTHGGHGIYSNAMVIRYRAGEYQLT